ncbi:MAG TPA: sigma factor, partial [Flavisolibacter sp.]|nr:sigma factor [Flavisolibacter sp.]
MVKDLVPHLFRTEFRKMTAVLCRQFGLMYAEEAEDIVSETFLAALETWPYKGVPESPAAWLYAVAKNKLRNRMSRNRLFREKIASGLAALSTDGTDLPPDWSDENIADSQLAMLFALCHPGLAPDAQIALSLRL